MNNITYKLSVNYNFDTELGLVFETRSIQREYTDVAHNKRKQFLKADMKEHTLNNRINNRILHETNRDSNLVIIERELTNEQIKVAMEDSFDLFTNIHQIETQNDSLLFVV